MAQTQLYTKRCQVAVKAETTVDTYIAAVLADAFIAELPDAPYTIVHEGHRPNVVRGDYLKTKKIVGAAYCTTAFRVPLKGSGVDATAAEWGPSLQSAGFTETLAAGGNTYVPLSTFDGAGGNPAQSYSLVVLENGTSYKMKGCFSNVVFNCQAGEPAYMEFAFTGTIPEATAFTDTAMLVPVYDTTIAPAFMGATFAQNFGGAVTPLGMTNLTIDMGNTITPVKDANAAYGYSGVRLTDRSITGTFDAQYRLEATANTGYRTLWSAGTAGSITTGVIGGTAENKWQLDIAACTLDQPEFFDEGGIRKVRLPFTVHSAETDVEETNPELTLTLP